MKGLDKQNRYKCVSCGLTFQDFSLDNGLCPKCFNESAIETIKAQAVQEALSTYKDQLVREIEEMPKIYPKQYDEDLPDAYYVNRVDVISIIRESEEKGSTGTINIQMTQKY